MAPHRTIAVLVTLALATTLAGCGFSSPPDAPRVVTRSIAHTLEALRAIAGVDTATGEASPIDSSWGGRILEGPDGWIVRISITADDSNHTTRALAESVDAVLDDSRDTLLTAANVRLSGAPGDAPATLEFGVDPAPIPLDDVVDAVIALRALDALETVTVSTGPDGSKVTVASPQRWGAAVAAIRALPQFGRAPLASAEVSSQGDARAESQGDAQAESQGDAQADATWAGLSFDATSPAPALVESLAAIASGPHLSYVNYRGVIDASWGDRIERWRPQLDVTAQTSGVARGIADELVALPAAASFVAGVPTAIYRVAWTGGTGGDDLLGFFGLAPGSPAPDDLLPAPVPEVGLIDPVVEAARLETASRVVTALLDAAGDAAGIRGQSSIRTVDCGENAGRQVEGSVTIPIFEIANSADDAFASITAGWGASGYSRVDRALGTDLYSAPALEELSIRGTAEGIAIRALSDCTG